MSPARGPTPDRLYAYGYQEGERFCKAFPQPDSAVLVKLHGNFDVNRYSRVPVQVSLGCHVSGLALPHPDTNGSTALAGALARFSMAVPAPDPLLARILKFFVSDWLDDTLVPLTLHDIPSFEEWLLHRPYPESRKKELREAFDSLAQEPLGSRKDDYDCKSFVKRENYPAYKYARAINSRSDRYKVSVGPVFMAIEKALFSLPWFIKKVPVTDRARLIRDTLESLGSMYSTTDYTSFEASFSPLLMEICEMQLYSFMLRVFDGQGNSPLTAIRRMMDVNLCRFKQFSVAVPGKRMSGDMCTSLGNSFTNLMLFLFLCNLKGMAVRGPFGTHDVVGFVEGDDGIFRTRLAPPTEEDAIKLGFLLKIEQSPEISEASFCGIVADSVDLVNVTDPVEALVGFGWALATYTDVKNDVLLQLLSAKSLSYLHQYPGCPVIQELALYGKRVGKPITDKVLYGRNMSVYERQMYLEAKSAEADSRLWSSLQRPPPANTRELVQRLYGLDVSAQLAIEEYLRSLTTLQPLNVMHLLPHRPIWVDYWETYVCGAKRLRNCLTLGPRGELPAPFSLVPKKGLGPDGTGGWSRVVIPTEAD